MPTRTMQDLLHMPCASVRRNRRWAVVLAGGEGLRLRPLTRFLWGDESPKLVCVVTGEPNHWFDAWRRGDVDSPEAHGQAEAACEGAGPVPSN